MPSQILQNITQKETELQKQYGSIANKIASLVPELGGETNACRGTAKRWCI